MAGVEGALRALCLVSFFAYSIIFRSRGILIGVQNLCSYQSRCKSDFGLGDRQDHMKTVGDVVYADLFTEAFPKNLVCLCVTEGLNSAAVNLTAKNTN